MFITTYEEIRGFKGKPLRIELKENARPVFQKMRRLSPEQVGVLREEIVKLLKVDIIYLVVHLDWASPVVIVPKKDGRWRICVDYKPLNAVTKANHYPLPHMDDILDRVAGHEMYSLCDGYFGYFLITIALKDQVKTTFITPWNCFCYKWMPFGLKNAPSQYQENSNQVLAPFLDKFYKVFIDDICV